MKGENRVCVIDDDDMKVLYFPFLIGALIFTATAIFGKFKKKDVLDDGTPDKVSH